MYCTIPSFSQNASVSAVSLSGNTHDLAVIAAALMDKGFRQVRVRIHGTLARIEVPVSDFDRIMQEDIRAEVADKFHE